MTDQPMIRPVIKPVEHCGDIPPAPFGYRTECVLRPGHSGSHADELGARWRFDPTANNAEQSARTTPDNPATSSDAPDSPLADVTRTAIRRYTTEQGEPADGGSVPVLEALGYHAMGQGIDLERRTAERDRLAATLRQVLDAFEAYWARASYCGPGDSAVQPEHFQAWRNALKPQETP